MRIERFEYFVEVARTGSITAAARRCYISQTALCQQMDALEQELGVKLLNRTKTGTTLTDAGEKLLPRAQTLLQEYQEIRRIFSREQTKENKLVIAYTGPLEQQMLLRSIPEFHRLCAQTDIQLRQRPMSAMGRELESGGVRSGPGSARRGRSKGVLSCYGDGKTGFCCGVGTFAAGSKRGTLYRRTAQLQYDRAAQ